jgi:drug/metabolite transporter (DMT)-like permease
MHPKSNARGVIAAFMTPIFLGMAPIFGKLAINAGADSFTVAAWRTIVSVLLLWILYALFLRRYIYIYPAGLLGCVVIGIVNGIGSLFYYGGLGLLDASLGQLLNGTYLIFVVLLERIGGERLEPRLIVRIALTSVALIILTGFGSKPINWLGVGLMLANAIMFAGTFILSQYVLYEMPAPTVALYVLTTMAVLVTMVWVAVGKPMTPQVAAMAIQPIFILGVTTAAARLSLFSGVKFLGSLQTAILALAEIGVALALAFFVLGDRLTGPQLIGVGVLITSILLIRPKDMLPRGINPNRLISNIADLQYQWIAFDQAFGKKKDNPEDDTELRLTTTEMAMIRRMMGVERGPVTPISLDKDATNPKPPAAPEDTSSNEGEAST